MSAPGKWTALQERMAADRETKPASALEAWQKKLDASDLTPA